MMKKGKVLALTMALAVFTSTNAMAATVHIGNDSENLWTESIYTEQNRIYGTGTYRVNYEWPGTDTLRNATYPNCLLEDGSMSIDEVFGEKCQDLLYTDLAKTKDPVAYMADGDRLLNNYQMTEHNGFLYVLTAGSKTTLTAKDGTDVDGVTKSYNVAGRSDTSGTDAYLYVFDISRGENYGKSRYARWSALDLGLQDGNGYQFMEGIAVDDNNIYILTCNGSRAATNAYARGVAVFKNTVKRGEEAVIPTRIDNITEGYVYGTKEVVPQSLTSKKEYQYYDSYIIGGNLVSFSDYIKYNLSSPASQGDAAVVYVTPVGNSIGETMVYYSADQYATESNSASQSIASILKSSIVSSWANATSPIIQNMYVNGAEITFLVTYTYGGKNYREVFVTDWSEVTAPVLSDSVAYETSDTDLSGYCYDYDGFIYVSSINGIDTIKKYDYNGINLTYNSKLDLSEINDSGKVLRIAVLGDYLFGWSSANQNRGYELKAKLSSDKTVILDSVHKIGALRTTDSLIYGGRIYTQWGGQSGIGDAARQSCIFVADLNKTMPVSVSVDKIDEKVSVPYTIEGRGYNIDAVKVIVNGQDNGYIDTIKDGSGEDKWQYTVTEAGEYTIEFIGASMKGYDSDETLETVKFTAYKREDISMTSSYTVADNKATVTVNITNPNETKIKAIPVAGLYGDNTMTDVAFGQEIEIGAGETNTVTLTLDIDSALASYKVKTFLIGGTNTIAPLTEAVEN